jgi:hypothetical protein
LFDEGIGFFFVFVGDDIVENTKVYADTALCCFVLKVVLWKALKNNGLGKKSDWHQCCPVLKA